MVDTQLASRGITDRNVLDVFRKVPRHIFVSDLLKEDAYNDHPLSIGYSQTISQPFMVALMTQCLELTGNEKILEIGTGSGYQTVILAELAKQVYTIERHKELFETARSNWEQLGVSNIFGKIDDGTAGWDEFAPYDGIIVTAGSPDVPDPLKQQLKDNGKMVIPVGKRFAQDLLVIKKEKKKFIQHTVCGCVFVPLIGKYGWTNGE